MPRSIVLFAFAASVGFGGCATPPTDPAAMRGPDAWSAPPIERSVSVRNGRTGAVVAFDDMLDALAAADAVFLGETHIDETTHRVELAVYEGLLARRDGRVVLAMEMFERDVQPVLDAYLAGSIDEEEFLQRARPWSQYRSAYRPLIERARQDGAPVVASNFPRPLTRRVAMEGIGVLDTLDPAQRRYAPAEIHPNQPEYWRRVDNAVRGHLAMMRRSGADDQRLSSTQTLWDNAMGESCALALDAYPGSAVLHVNGGFHSAYWDGTVYQLRLRKPDARVLTVDIRPARSPGSIDLQGAPTADFVVAVEARATDLNDGTWSVAYDRAIDYELHLPSGARDDARVPLIIWLGDDGLTAQDGLDLWIDRLGEDAAIVVIEPPYRAILDDLSSGGRWFWSDSFMHDVGAATAAIERIWAYVLRYFPVDPDRVCLAGEGTGATVAAAAGLLGDRMSASVVAFQPRRYSKIKDFPLPLPEYRGGERKASIGIVGTEEDGAWWSDELAAYRDIGIAGTFEDLGAADLDHLEHARLRAAVGLPDVAPPAPPGAMMFGGSPRARHWARLYVLRGGSGDPVIDAATVGDALPRCPGAFGGTTVVVVPADADPAVRDAWIALEEDDPINRSSRFHRLRIAVAGDETGRDLASVLAQLDAEDRRNVLIVPATFCASAATMRVLEDESRSVADRMTVQWLPGLGGVIEP